MDLDGIGKVLPWDFSWNQSNLTWRPQEQDIVPVLYKDYWRSHSFDVGLIKLNQCGKSTMRGGGRPLDQHFISGPRQVYPSPCHQNIQLRIRLIMTEVGGGTSTASKSLFHLDPDTFDESGSEVISPCLITWYPWRLIKFFLSFLLTLVLSFYLFPSLLLFWLDLFILSWLSLFLCQTLDHFSFSSFIISFCLLPIVCFYLLSVSLSYFLFLN